MQEKPFFSIITIGFNNLNGLHKTRTSIDVQGFDDYEWLVVDGGSTDGSAEYLHSINADFTSEPDKGIYDAMNKGLARARGEYILFLNSGDELAGPHVLSKIAAAASAKPDFIYGDFLEERGGENFEKRARSHAKKVMGMFTSHQSMFYRREALGDMRYDLSYKQSADYHFTCKFLEKTDHVLYVPVSVSIFESGGVSQKNRMRSRMENLRVREELGLCNSLTSHYILGRNILGSAFRAVSPSMFLKLRNLQGVEIPTPSHEKT